MPDLRAAIERVGQFRTEEQWALTIILAEIDALWEPNGGGDYSDRREYARIGVPWYGLRDEGPHRRKRSQRVLEKLEDAGLAETFNRPGAKRTYVKLSEEGETIARRINGLPSLEDAKRAMKRLATLSSRKSDGWVSRGTFGDIDALTPAFCREWVKATGIDADGEFSLSLTAEGRAVIAR
ncbi:MAG: hypothetical protein L0Y71_26060 [Gemmataceae bacterium]|nr:hypothetical protein [Gemmataceae bacterium]